MTRRKGRVVYRGEQPKLATLHVSEDVFSEMLAKRILRLREASGAMQSTLGDALGVDDSSVSRLENNEMQMSAYRALAVAVALDVPIEELLSIEEASNGDPIRAGDLAD